MFKQYRTFFILIIIFETILHIKAQVEDTTEEIQEVLPQFTTQKFKYLLVVDFEANIWDEVCDASKYGLEMIEFSCVLYDVAHDKILSEFQQYVKPYRNQKLTEYCKRITKITQESVDKGIDIGTCLTFFDKWISLQEKKFNITLSPESQQAVIVAWTNWHIAKCLKYECLRRYLRIPAIFEKWIELRTLFINFYKRDAKPLYGALRMLDINFDDEPDQHLHGIVDARNIIKLLREMIASGVTLELTGKL